MDNETGTQATNESEVEAETTTEESTEQNDSHTSSEHTDREKQLFARLKKEELRRKELESELADREESTEEPTHNKPMPRAKDLERIELIALGYKDDAELRFIMRNGGIDALEDPFVSKAIKTMKDEREAREKSSSGVSSKSGVSKQFTPQQVRSMSSDDYAKKVLGYNP